MREKICFIPARGGSKRLGKKNLALFKGKTLIAHTIEQAKECGLFDHIILSSDDDDILSAGRKYDIEIHHRPQSLATDNVKIIDVIREIVISRPIAHDSVIGLLLTTCPLRSIEDVRSAYDVFENAGCRSTVVSVKRNESPIQLCWKEIEGHLEPVFPEEYQKSTRKQDHYGTYSYNDAVIFDLAENFSDSSRNLFGPKPIPYIMPWERSIPIDYEFQLKICQYFGEMEKSDAGI